jgi:hypothetical protein
MNSESINEMSDIKGALITIDNKVIKLIIFQEKIKFKKNTICKRKLHHHPR